MTPTRAVLLALLLLPAPALGQTAAQIAARTKGVPSAPVTVYEMSDFQCPFCRRFALETFPTIEREYIATGKVRWIFVNMPLTEIHQNAVPAAQFATCAARQGKFWPAHDALFLTQDTWGPLRNPGPFLLSLVDSLGIAKGPINACLQNNETVAEIRLDAEGAQRAGATSTPTFYVEGLLIKGAHPIGVFRQVFDSLHAAKRRR